MRLPTTLFAILPLSADNLALEGQPQVARATYRELIETNTSFKSEERPRGGSLYRLVKELAK